MGYVKGIEKEAKLAINYVLKHFYTKYTPQLGNAPSGGALTVYSNVLDMDLIHDLHISGSISCSSNTAAYRIELNDVSLYQSGQMADGTVFRRRQDCSSKTGEQRLHIYVTSGYNNNPTINDLSIYVYRDESIPW